MTHLAPVTAIYISSHRDGWDLTDLVEAKSIHGALAIHLELGSKHHWAVTHVPSGRYIAARIESFSAAESIVDALLETGIDWTAGDTESSLLTRDQAARVRAIVSGRGVAG